LQNNHHLFPDQAFDGSESLHRLWFQPFTEIKIINRVPRPVMMTLRQSSDGLTGITLPHATAKRHPAGRRISTAYPSALADKRNWTTRARPDAPGQTSRVQNLQKQLEKFDQSVIILIYGNPADSRRAG
jgi:hypothetical protein